MCCLLTKSVTDANKFPSGDQTAFLPEMTKAVLDILPLDLQVSGEMNGSSVDNFTNVVL